MTPDPVYDKLARFTPGAAPDPAEVLFRAGRASARTPPGWKLAVAGLILANAATAGVLLLRDRPLPPPSPAPLPVPVVTPVIVPAAEAAPPSPPRPARWSYGALKGITDPDDLPRPDAVTGPAPADRPLTPLSARRGEID